jgi:integrase
LNERIVSKPSAKTAFGIGPFARAFSFASMYQAASDFFPECAERFALCAGVTIDLSTGQMSVSGSIEQTKGGKKALPFKSPKSGKGRTVELSPTVVEELRTHRAKRAEVLLRLGVRLSEDDFVTAHPDGSVMVPIYISQRWDRFIKTTKLPRIRFHDLRHTHAVRPKIRQRALGHSKVAITLDLYSHVIPGMQEDAAAMVDAALKAAADSGNKMVVAR